MDASGIWRPLPQCVGEPVATALMLAGATVMWSLCLHAPFCPSWVSPACSQPSLLSWFQKALTQMLPAQSWVSLSPPVVSTQLSFLLFLSVLGLLEWVTIPSSRGSSWHRDRTHVSHVSFIDRRVLYHQCDLESPAGLLLVFKAFTQALPQPRQRFPHLPSFWSQYETFYKVFSSF